MVAITTSYYNTGYASAAAAQARTATAAPSGAGPGTTATASADTAASSITLSDAARASLDERSFTAVIADTRRKLDALLLDADRTSPLEGKRLALDLASLDQRELFALATDKSFTADETGAAALEMQRRFEAALAGHAAVAEVTGNYTNLYKAAAAYLDSLSPEEKAGADWIAGRNAVTEGLKQLQADPRTLPAGREDDPVALYLKLVDASDAAAGQDGASLAANARKSLDKLYANALAAGKAPTFNRNTTVGTFIDLSGFSSSALSAIALDEGDRFTTEESSAARTALRAKTGAALTAGFKDAQKSGDPTAFSQNIIAAFSSLTPAERQAAGWSDQLYQAAIQNYASTQKLLSMFSQSGGSTGGPMSWLGR